MRVKQIIGEYSFRSQTHHIDIRLGVGSFIQVQTLQFMSDRIQDKFFFANALSSNVMVTLGTLAARPFTT